MEVCSPDLIRCPAVAQVHLRPERKERSEKIFTRVLSLVVETKPFHHRLMLILCDLDRYPGGKFECGGVDERAAVQNRVDTHFGSDQGLKASGIELGICNNRQ